MKMTNTTRPTYPAAPSFWQAVLDLALAHEYEDGTDALPVSEYVAMYADKSVGEIIDHLGRFYDGRIEIHNFVRPNLTQQQRRVMMEQIVADWLEVADRADIVELLIEGESPLIARNATDAEIVGMWGDLGNENLPGVDGTFE
jgi:hypothetical protein